MGAGSKVQKRRKRRTGVEVERVIPQVLTLF